MTPTNHFAHSCLFKNTKTIHSCENASKRVKVGSQKGIRCSMRNSSTGDIDHFVVNKKKMKGCWMANDQVEVLSLVCKLHRCRESHRQPRLQRMEEKKKADMEMEKVERAKKAAEDKRKAEEE